MAHFIVEYTRNIAADADIPSLLRKANDTIIAQGGVFPTGGIRSRAIEFADYCIADGAGDYAFVHVTFKIASGRDPVTKQRACDALFDMVKAHFADLYARRLLALSMEVYEFPPPGTWKYSNLHEHLRKGASA